VPFLKDDDVIYLLALSEGVEPSAPSLGGPGLSDTRAMLAEKGEYDSHALRHDPLSKRS